MFIAREDGCAVGTLTKAACLFSVTFPLLVSLYTWKMAREDQS